MTTETVSVSWYNCDCGDAFGFTSKYCDEYHQSYARIPKVVLEQYEVTR